MDFITILLVAVGLSMDSFAISVTSGMIIREFTFRKISKIALFLASTQAIMTALGWLLGFKLRHVIENYDHWVSFALLLLIGGKMIYESFNEAEQKKFNPLNNLVLLGISLATSIDALAIGLSFALLNISISFACFVIGLVTLISAVTGLRIGTRICDKLSIKTELWGGLILIAIGIKILVEHTYWN